MTKKTDEPTPGKVSGHLRTLIAEMLAELEFAYAYLSKEPGRIAWKEGITRMERVIKKAKGES